jgi:hypothetical protein
MALPIAESDPEGFETEVFVRGGSMQNQGIELGLSIAAVRTTTVRWDANLTAWGNQNRVESIPSDVPLYLFNGTVTGYMIMPGHSLYALYQPNLSFHDANGDGVIEPNEITLTAGSDHGSSEPTRGAGLQNTVALLGNRLRIGALVDYKGGNKLIDPFLTIQSGTGAARASATRGTPLAEQAETLATELGGNNYGAYYGPAQDASFVRFRELSVTVNATPAIARALRTNSAAISLVARNLWLWTAYRGTDPEINTGSDLSPMVSQTVIPQPRYFVARVTLGY